MSAAKRCTATTKRHGQIRKQNAGAFAPAFLVAQGGMTLDRLNILVIGAGIGGLAAAIALRRCGAFVRVVEQAQEISEVGAGLQISPNGFAVLNAMGLADALRDVSVQGKEIKLKDYSDRAVTTLDLSLSGHSEYHFLHRADLQGLLLKAAKGCGVEIATGFKISEVIPGSSPTVKDIEGGTHSADLIVGADGLHSVARAALNGTLAPFFTQQAAWRAVVPDVSAAPRVDLYMGPRRHIVTYPLRGGKWRNIVAIEERPQWVAESWSQEDDADSLRKVFSDFGAEVQLLLSKVERVSSWGLFRHPVAPVWHRENVTLLGDAAHPTLPFLAQGANMALEDAWVLADALAGADNPGAGLALYQKKRETRVKRVIDAASGNAWKYHLSFKPFRWAAHTGLRVAGKLAPGRMIGQFDWLYGHDVTQASARRGS